MVAALGYYYIISFTWCTFAATLYVKNGYGDFSLIIPSSIGALVGAHLGSSIGRAKGSQFVRHLFIAIGAVLGIKLALGY